MKADDPVEHAPRQPGLGRMADKVVVLTGGTSGIGRAIAHLFAREGAALVLPWTGDRAPVDSTLNDLAAEGCEPLVIEADLRQRDACVEVIRQAVTRHGRIDGLICNAGVQTMRDDVADIGEDDLENLFRINVFSGLWLVQAALPHMARPSSIIFTTSACAYHGNGMLVDYSASKSAQVGLLRGLAAQLAPRGIRVNGVAPGPVWTPLTRRTMPEGTLDGFGVGLPLGRAAQPNEIAPSFLFLVSEDASFMTGQVLHPNGGLLMGS